MTTEHFPQDIPADAQAFMDRLKSEVIPRIERLTVPFFHLMKDPRTNEYGVAGKDRSGILLRIGDEHFILTAARFIQDYVDRGVFIFMSWDDEKNCPIPVTGDQIALTDQSSMWPRSNSWRRPPQSSSSGTAL